jgi:hypothetical protein
MRLMGLDLKHRFAACSGVCKLKRSRELSSLNCLAVTLIAREMFDRVSAPFQMAEDHCCRLLRK